MILGFKTSGTEDIYNGKNTTAARRTLPPHLWKQAQRRLDALNAAADLTDLRIPPGNHLEALHGNREGQYSIRINNRYRICFSWTAQGPDDVEIIDYH